MKSRILSTHKTKQPSAIRTRRGPAAVPSTMSEVNGRPNSLEVKRRTRFDLKPARTLKPHRRGTARALVVDLLGKGSTLHQVMKLTGWTYRQAVEGIRLVNKQLGYGVKEAEDGTIVLKRPKR